MGLGCISPEADAETRIWVQVTDLGREGKKAKEIEKEDREGKTVLKDALLSQLPLRATGPRSHWGNWRSQCRAHASVIPPEGRDCWGVYTPTLSSYSLRIAWSQCQVLGTPARLCRNRPALHVRTDQPSVTSGRALDNEIQTQAAGSQSLVLKRGTSSFYYIQHFPNVLDRRTLPPLFLST